jgi:hypothetical protein
MKVLYRKLTFITESMFMIIPIYLYLKIVYNKTLLILSRTLISIRRFDLQEY